MLAERLTAQLLSGAPTSDPVAVAERLPAAQGQDPRGARLAVRARTSGLLASDVDRALSEDRSLLITWLNRGTLHLVRSEDYPWLHTLTVPPLFTGNARRLLQEGVEPDAADRGVSVIERSLADEGPLTRAPPPRLLGPFDPLLLGWTSREPIVGSHKDLVTVNGIFRPFALVGGRAVATWSMPGGEVKIEPFGRLARGDAAALEAEAADVVRFLAV